MTRLHMLLLLLLLLLLPHSRAFDEDFRAACAASQHVVEVLRITEPSGGKILQHQPGHRTRIAIEVDVAESEGAFQRCFRNARVCAVLDDKRWDMYSAVGQAPPQEELRRSGGFIGCRSFLSLDPLYIDHDMVSPGPHAISLYVVTEDARGRMILAPEWLYPVRPAAVAIFRLGHAAFDFDSAVHHAHVRPITGECEAGPDDLIIACYTNHDAALTVTRGGYVVLVLELERLFNERYFRFNLTHASAAREQVARAVLGLYSELRKLGHDTAPRFKCGVIIGDPVWMEYQVMWARGNLHIGSEEPAPNFIRILADEIESEQWLACDHHYAHAMLGFLASGYERALVISADGGGNDGVLSVYSGDRSNFSSPLQLLKNFGFKASLGVFYTRVAEQISEIMERREPCDYVAKPATCLSLPGVLMGYAALASDLPLPGAQFESSMERCLKDFLHSGRTRCSDVPPTEDGRGATRDRRVASYAQKVFERSLADIVNMFLDILADAGHLVLTGGCALNVKANSFLQRRLKVPTFVPSAPNDAGLTVGGAWAVYSPWTWQPLTYVGMHISDQDRLQDLVRSHGGERFTLDQLANLLHSGAVVGLVRGRQEFGPRALGHRSLVAIPFAGAKERMNAVKRREFFRPVAPVITTDSVRRIFTPDTPDSFSSPYMSFTANLREEVSKSFPAVKHYDGSARPQTVERWSEPWLYALLRQIGRLTGYPMLINTSFNVKGKPMVNSAAVALEMLCTIEDLDFVVVEDYLFSKQKCVSTRF